MNLDLLMTHN